MRRLWLLVALCGSCGDSSSVINRPDAAKVVDARTTSGDSAPGLRCGLASLPDNQVPVSGTFHGSKLDGVVCENGLGTDFLSPGPAARPVYTQSFSMPSSPAGDRLTNFQFNLPSEVSAAFFQAGIDTAFAAVGAYSSDQQCGSIRFEVQLPIPPGVFCPTLFGPCDPGCEGYGEMAICQPGHPRLIYLARTGASCATSQDIGIGDWRLTLASVVPHVVPGTLINYQTHGHLSATLVSEADSSDTVAVELDF